MSTSGSTEMVELETREIPLIFDVEGLGVVVVEVCSCHRPRRRPGSTGSHLHEVARAHAHAWVGTSRGTRKYHGDPPFIKPEPLPVTGNHPLDLPSIGDGDLERHREARHDVRSGVEFAALRQRRGRRSLSVVDAGEGPASAGVHAERLTHATNARAV